MGDRAADLPSDVLRALAERLNLPWPDWLTTQQPWPQPPPADVRHDATRVHAVLAAVFGQPLHLSEIAHVLGWTTDRVHTAAQQLATRARPGGGTRLHVDGDTLTLDLAPRMLDTAARRRLNRLLNAHGLGPDPHVLYLIYQLTSGRGGASNVLAGAPGLLEEAIEYGLLAADRDEQTGVTHFRLHPAVAYSLGRLRDPPDEDDDQDQSTEDS